MESARAARARLIGKLSRATIMTLSPSVLATACITRLTRTCLSQETATFPATIFGVQVSKYTVVKNLMLIFAIHLASLIVWDDFVENAMIATA
jgi:hypothetical protein